jgi:SAM-dependent methyltransferase
MIEALRRFSPLRRKLRAAQATVLRRLGVRQGDWGTALQDETAFWELALADGGRNWVPGEFARRMDPSRPLQRELQVLLPANAGERVRVLDVGAGPLTTLGKTWEGHEMEITAIDPLAERYDELLARLNITPPVRTLPGHGEKVLELFPENHFHLAYASNALDHAYEPLRAIRQMIAAVQPGCYVYLWHFANEGLHEYYRGLHQWNFDIRDDDFIISDGRRSHALKAALAGAATVSCERLVDYDKPVVVARLKKAVAA